MAKFLTTKMIASGIESIIRKSKEKVVIVSPYLKISQDFYERILRQLEKGVEITIIYGKTDLKPNERAKLLKLKNLKVYYLSNLHAKCYLNEKMAIIGSMNFYEYSEMHNREMGMFISSKQDPDVYNEIVEEINSIINVSVSKSESSFSEVDANDFLRIVQESDYSMSPHHDKVEDFFLPSLNMIISKYFENIHSNMVLGDEDHNFWVINLVLPKEKFKQIEIQIDKKVSVHFNDEKMTRYKSQFVNHLETKLSNLRPRIYDNYFSFTIYRPQYMSSSVDMKSLKEVTNFFVKTLLILLYELEKYVLNCDKDTVDIDRIYA